VRNKNHNRQVRQQIESDIKETASSISISMPTKKFIIHRLMNAHAGLRQKGNGTRQPLDDDDDGEQQEK